MCHLLLLYCVRILCCVGYSWSTADTSTAFEPDTGLSKGSAVDAAFVTDDKVTVMCIVCGDNGVCRGIVYCPELKKTNKDIPTQLSLLIVYNTVYETFSQLSVCTELVFDWCY